MRKVNSSNIDAFQYEEEDEAAQLGTLTIRFRNGRTYEYPGFPTEVADLLSAAADAGESVGSVFSREIRPRYAAVEITE